jgi:HSP20 family protein
VKAWQSCCVSRKIQAIRLRRLQGKVGELAHEFTKVHFARLRNPDPSWKPAVNLFQCYHCFRICVDLAGVEPKDIDLTIEPERLWIRGHRSPPEPQFGDDLELAFAVKTVRLLAMEIGYGRFEREVPLPKDADLGRIATAWDNGILWIEIPRLNQA